MKLLLHMCCAPSDRVLKSLPIPVMCRFSVFTTISTFTRNRKTVPGWFRFRLYLDEQFPVVIEEAMMLIIERKAQGEKELRCSLLCLRVDRMVEMTRERGMDAFTTSLLISPWQNHETIKRLAKLPQKYKVDFYLDFRPIGEGRMGRGEDITCRNIADVYIPIRN